MAESGQKMAATVKVFSDDLNGLGLGGDQVFVDFVAQNKIYGFEVAGDLAREKLVGFELKKNVSIHYRDPDLLDKIVVAAARSKIFDLIKVDYVLKDINTVQDKLMDEAARIIKQKIGATRGSSGSSFNRLRRSTPKGRRSTTRPGCTTCTRPRRRSRCSRPGTTGRRRSPRRPARAEHSSITVWTEMASTL